MAVVVPTYNAEEHLAACLSSLTSLQSPPGGYRVLVVDGGSSDATLSIAREHGVDVLEAPGTGIAEARNRALAETEAEVLAFVDADCRAPEDMLAAAVERLDEHAAVGAFYEPATEHGWVARDWLAVERKAPGPVAWVPAGTLAVRREALAAVDGFREDLAASEDVDLCRRLRANGCTVYHEPAMACQHLGQPDDLRAFFANEVGRAASLVRSSRQAGGFDAEHATLALALAYLSAPVALVAAAVAGGAAWAGLVLAALAAPTVAWSLLASARAGWRHLPGVLVLLFVYNVARATSLVEHRQWRQLT